jgi:hypothetical protein
MAITAACGGPESGGGASREPEPATEAEKRAKGEDLLKRVSERIAAAQAFSFTTSEVVERVRKSGEKITLNLNREVAVQRPNRLWYKATGDRDLESFYNGENVTLVSHKEKVWAEIPAPPTIDETVDVMSERYDIPMPIGDMISTNPHESLISEDTTGGWAGTENIDGISCRILSWQHPNVDWKVWIPASGEPLPKKLEITYKARRGQPKTILNFKEWNLAPQFTDATFTRRVPDDYEGIPVVQRASAVLTPEEAAKPEPAPAATKEAAGAQAKPKQK